ncbi:MAG: hypothetical protein M1814_003060 [Vezdaea aestivalis]|nr:MAG: hypothetical protein M1814_003060 [Vezdaea aestivalis]
MGSPTDPLPVNGSTTAPTTPTPLRLPFQTLSASSHPPGPRVLTADQETKYNSLLATASSWTTLPSSPNPKASAPRPITSDERMWLTRECLLRYLRATKWSVPDAERRLLSTLTWRRSYGVEEHSAEYISVENETGKQFIFGWDVSGRPCHYLNPIAQNTSETPRQLHHLVYMLERAIDLMPAGVETLALLINFAKTDRKHNASIAQGKETLNILQNHYPERLGRAIVVNVPWVMWGFFKLVGPFIDPATKEKLKFDEKDVGSLVPIEQLWDQMGGEVKFEYAHDEYWPVLNRMCEERRTGMRKRWIERGEQVGESEVFLKGGDDDGELKEVKKQEKANGTTTAEEAKSQETSTETTTVEKAPPNGKA